MTIVSSSVGLTTLEYIDYETYILRHTAAPSLGPGRHTRLVLLLPALADTALSGLLASLSSPQLQILPIFVFHNFLFYQPLL